MFSPKRAGYGGAFMTARNIPTRSILQWIVRRLREPTTYAGTGLVAQQMHHIIDPLTSDPKAYGLAVCLVTAIAGLLAIVLREKGVVDVDAPE